MPRTWRPRDGCWQCDAAAYVEDPADERERRKLELGICGIPPESMDVRDAEGKCVRYRIPRALRRARVAL